VLVTGAALSIDNLAAGFALGTFDVSPAMGAFRQALAVALDFADVGFAFPGDGEGGDAGGSGYLELGS
jgi:putative Mn2+ efflux pump MntP